MVSAVSQFANTDLEPVPARAGIGLKPIHYETVLRDLPDVGFFEIHAENYMGAGGPPHRYLTAICNHYPLSVHGVGLSLGGPNIPDVAHLGRLSAVVDRYQPGLVSEHLAWSGLDGRFANDLLPLPYTRQSLERTLAHVDRTQMALGRRILIENPATYIRFAESDLHEGDFLRELAQRSGCGLLLDVNNVHVASLNHGFSARDYLAAFPLAFVDEIHVAGNQPHCDADGSMFLIDSHDQPVSKEVWQLLDETLERTGPLPVLLERDGNIPAWQELAAEAGLADSLLERRTATPENRQLVHA